MIVLVGIGGIVVNNLKLLGTVVICCSTIYLQKDDELLNSYNMIVPKGVESFNFNN